MNHSVMNAHGKELRKICRSFKCYVVNNLNFKKHIFDGGFTFHKNGNKSQNDLLLGNIGGLNAIKDFDICGIGWNPSDHLPILAKMEICIKQDNLGLIASKDIVDGFNSEDLVKPKKIISSLVDWNTFSHIVGSDIDGYKESFEDLAAGEQSQCCLDKVVEALSDSLYNAAEVSTNTPSKMEPEKIDDEMFERANEFFRNHGEGTRSFEDWDKVRQEAISHLIQNTNTQERENWAYILSQKDSKCLWEKINWKGGFESSKLSAKPSLNKLAAQFKSKDQAQDNSTLLSEVTGSNYVSVLDDEITLDEITEARDKIKEGKTTGDGWVKGMITNIPASLLIMIQIIFNTILSSNIYPRIWRRTIVTEIFKNKGSEEHEKNYRPVTLVQLLSKMLDFIFVERFKSWFKPSDEQSAYQSKKSSSDHVFLIRCIIQHAKRAGKTMYVIAVDFDGAFDRVCRSLLIRKLIMFGAGIVFTSCIASIYMCHLPW